MGAFRLLYTDCWRDSVFDMEGFKTKDIEGGGNWSFGFCNCHDCFLRSAICIKYWLCSRALGWEGFCAYFLVAMQDRIDPSFFEADSSPYVPGVPVN